MNFELDDTQQQFQATVERLMVERYDAAQRRRYLQEPQGYSAALWQSYAALGLTALHVPAALGGLGGSPLDQYAVMRALGRGPVLEPVLGSCVAATVAVGHGGSAEQCAALLPEMAAGERIVAWAHEEGGAARSVQTRAEAQGGGWRLHGRKTCVLHGAAAHALLVSALLPGGELGLFLVPAGAHGLRLRHYLLLDGSAAADLEFQSVDAERLGEAGAATFERAQAMATAAVCAEAVGAMRAALELTLAYLGTRQQFGKPLSANQALRHRCADMAVLLECSESMAMLAALAVADPAACRPGDLQAAKLLVGRHGRTLCEGAVQLHGGIGMTEEYGVGRYLQRLLVLDQLYGDGEGCWTDLSTARSTP